MASRSPEIHMSAQQDDRKPLDYHKPDPSENRMAIQALTGCAVAATIVGGCAFLAGFAGFTTGYANQASPWRALPVVGAIIVTGIGAVVFWAIRAGRNQRWRGFAMGLWIGLGVGLLGAGICFGRLM